MRPAAGDQLQLRGDPGGSVATSLAGVCRSDIDDYLVHFRLPDTLDLMAIGDLSNLDEATRSLLGRCILNASYRGEEIAFDALPEMVHEAALKLMNESDPQADVQLDLSCPECGHNWQAAFDILSYLWEEIDAWALRILNDVHVLAFGLRLERGGYPGHERLEKTGLSGAVEPMNNYLKNIAAKNLHVMEVIQPRLASRFEPVLHHALPISWSLQNSLQGDDGPSCAADELSQYPGELNQYPLNLQPRVVARQDVARNMVRSIPNIAAREQGLSGQDPSAEIGSSRKTGRKAGSADSAIACRHYPN